MKQRDKHKTNKRDKQKHIPNKYGKWKPQRRLQAVARIEPKQWRRLGLNEERRGLFWV